MITSTKKRLATSLVVMTAVAAATFGSSAKADPAAYNSFVAVGSDTVQDVMNAFSGNTNGKVYTPLASSAATGSKQILSFDAIPPAGVADTCITTKLKAPSFDRPNGSGKGITALSRSIQPKVNATDTVKGWGTATCSGPTDVSGLIDFARSSAGTANATATGLTFIPFGRDAVSFAYYQNAPTVSAPTVTALSRKQLIDLFTNGTLTVTGTGVSTTIVPCGIQTGSGTHKFWLKTPLNALAAATEDTATALCNKALSTATPQVAVRAEENSGQALHDRGVAVAGLTDVKCSTTGTTATACTNVEVVIGFSAGSFIAKSNGNAPAAGVSLVGLGTITDDSATATPSGVVPGSPISGTAPSLVPASTFYGNANFGRDVYTVWPTSTIDTTGFSFDQAAIDLVVGPTSKMCAAGAAQTTINAFGFLSAANCGSTTMTDGVASYATNS